MLKNMPAPLVNSFSPHRRLPRIKSVVLRDEKLKGGFGLPRCHTVFGRPDAAA
jgi:hypothetical protein